MNTRVNPCDDFYNYACGNWGKNKTSWTQFSLLSDKTMYLIKQLLESDWKEEKDNSAVIKAKKFYRACMDTQAIEKRGISGLSKLVDDVGGWPLTMSDIKWQDEKKKISWQTLDTRIHKIMGDSALFSIRVIIDTLNTSSHILTLASPRAKSPTGFVSLIDPLDMDQPPVVNYRNSIANITKLIAKQQGRIVDNESLDNDIKDIVAFEVQLDQIAMIQKTNSTTPDVNDSFRKMTIYELQQEYDIALDKKLRGNVVWLERIQNILSVSNIKVDNSTLVEIFPRQYFSRLATLISQTQEKVIINSMQWWMIKQLLRHTNHEMQKLVDSLDKFGPKLSRTKQRWMFCMTTHDMEHAVAYEYVQKYFPKPASKSAVEVMMRQIISEMRNNILESTWLDRKSKNSALNKLNGMKQFVGFPDWYSNDTLISNYYNQLKIGENHLENKLAARAFGLKMNLNMLKEPVNKKKWLTDPAKVNAFYSYSGNSITIPAAILHVPFFTDQQPDAVNYGSIGNIIGHEVSHGFDDVGRQYDKDGNLVNWWSESTSDEYNNRAGCFVDKFSKFQVQHRNITYQLNPVSTLSENIADSTGIRAVFKAFQTHTANASNSSSSTNMRLPGLENLNTRKLFFLSYAHTFCEALPVQTLVGVMARGGHCPGIFRVHGTLSNLKEFTEAFECPSGAPMNSILKCGIWY